MNLLGRSVGLALAGALLFFACEDPSEIGEELGSNRDKLGVQFAEIIVPTTNVLLDSVITTSRDTPLGDFSSDVSMLTGGYDDPFTGRIDAVTFTKLFVSDTSSNLEAGDQFDSLILDMGINYTYGIDTLGPHKLRVYQLADTITSLVGTEVLEYFNDSAEPLLRQIGEADFADSTGRLTMKLDTQFGEELLAEMLANSIHQDNALLNPFIKGFAFMGDPAQQLIVGFENNDNTGLTIYYSQPGDTEASSFKFNLGSLRYNQILGNRIGTSLEGITEPYTSFDPGDGFIYSQEAIGIVPVMDFSFLTSLSDTISNVFAVSSQLLIEGLEVSEGRLAPPSNIYFLLTDDTNRPIEVASGLLLFNEETNGYALDVTTFVQEILRGREDRTKIMIFSNQTEEFPRINPRRSLLNRFIIPSENIKMRMFYSNPN